MNHKTNTIRIGDDQFETWMNSVGNVPKDVYLMTYQQIVRWFAAADWDNADSVCVGSSIVYGWMPTRLHIVVKPLESSDAIRFPKLLKETVIPDFVQFSAAVQWFSGSVVAASKFSHFINPSVYPIWDSRIAELLTSNGHYYSVNDQSKYKQYLKECHRLASSGPGKRAAVLIRGHGIGDVTPIRAIELVLFYASAMFEKGKKESQP